MQNIVSKLLIFLFVFLVSCTEETPEYYYTDGGLKYKYHDLTVDGEKPEVGDYLSIYVQFQSETGEVIYNSFDNHSDGIEVINLGEPKVTGGIEEGFAKLQEGDSVTFFIEPGKFYLNYLGEEVPEELTSDKEMRVVLRLLKVQNYLEYQESQQQAQEIAELTEFKNIQEVVSSWKAEGDSVSEFDGVYMVYDSVFLTDSIQYADLIQLHYTGEFLNGEVFYSTYENGFPDEFQVGKTDQTVEGLKKALLYMAFGQKAKVIVPSYLGFGEKGSAGGVVPPFTPVIYRLEVLEKEEI